MLSKREQTKLEMYIFSFLIYSNKYFFVFPEFEINIIV